MSSLSSLALLIVLCCVPSFFLLSHPAPPGPVLDAAPSAGKDGGVEQERDAGGASALPTDPETGEVRVVSRVEIARSPVFWALSLALAASLMPGFAFKMTLASFLSAAYGARSASSFCRRRRRRWRWQ